MDIYIPKYKDFYIKDGEIGVRASMKGEYRALLYGPDGRLKSDSGWQPNTVLNQGFAFMCTNSYYGLWRGGMALGDSDIAVDVTQTGLQGTALGGSNWAQDSVSNISAINGGAPNYESIVTNGYTFNAGNSTGTVKEFILMAIQFNDVPAGNTALDGTIRVVLNSPIVKGAADYLTIEHRFTHYPELNDVTGVIDISGVAYNYLLRGIEIDANVSKPANCYWHNGGHRSGDTDDMTANTGIGPSTQGNDYATGSNIYYPAAPTPYVTGVITADVDYWVKDIRCMVLNCSGMFSTYQIRLGKVSDDSPHEKLNTHTFQIGINMYPTRYVP